MIRRILVRIGRPGRRRLRRLVRRQPGPVRIIIGAAPTTQPGWLQTQRNSLDLLDSATFDLLLGGRLVDSFVAEHVWEHLTPEQALVAAANCFDVLRPGGCLRIAVPDGWSPIKDYIAAVRPGGSGPGAEDHQVLYNLSTLRDLLVTAGFEVCPLEYFDENGQLITRPIDPERGTIRRSATSDPRNADGTIRYTSLIVDAIKPQVSHD